MGLSIGSKKPDAKVININLKYRHLILGLILALGLLFFFTDKDSLLITEVTCPYTDVKEIITKETLFICGELVPLHYTNKEKILYYNNKINENGRQIQFN